MAKQACLGQQCIQTAILLELPDGTETEGKKVEASICSCVLKRMCGWKMDLRPGGLDLWVRIFITTSDAAKEAR